MPRRKFDDVPTESMFDDAEVEAFREEKPKPERAKTIASGRCPECSNPRLGVTRQGEHLVWREHTYTTWSGARLTCRASGVATCVAPEPLSRDYPRHVALLCPHARQRGNADLERVLDERACHAARTHYASPAHVCPERDS